MADMREWVRLARLVWAAYRGYRALHYRRQDAAYYAWQANRNRHR